MSKSNYLKASRHDKRIKRQKDRERQVHSIKPELTLRGYGFNYKYKNINYIKLYDIMLKLKNRRAGSYSKISVMIKLGGSYYDYDKVNYNLANEIMDSIKQNRVA